MLLQTLNPSANPSSTPTRVPSRSPTRAPSMKPSDSPITSSPSPAPSPKPTDDPVSSVTKYCGCDSCTQQVWDTLVMDAAGTYSCGERITWLQTQGYDEIGACVKVAGEIFSDGSCWTECHPHSIAAVTFSLVSSMKMVSDGLSFSSSITL